MSNAMPLSRERRARDYNSPTRSRAARRLQRSVRPPVFYGRRLNDRRTVPRCAGDDRPTRVADLDGARYYTIGDSTATVDGALNSCGPGRCRPENVARASAAVVPSRGDGAMVFTTTPRIEPATASPD